ncbi:hypothetical protein BUALT_Bualt03G0156700 [Buddleja alternifolia]|uniref:DDE Tnp4 domain-containing protein n=1 Tax=Buddleja alternifolia TaxID=168488 RepID=A0AAV6Y0Q8_9LAMI|nr:hypothetical protein BUALT_Bualt03G0156700 [Buddleja alternifolia]
MPTYSLKMKIQKQLEHMHDLVSYNDETCIDNLRMSRNAFGRLCYLLGNVGGLVNTTNVTVSALDGTYIPLRVAQKDKPRYRNRKGDVSVNVLAMCDIHMNYVYMLCGWEGSAADSRVLKDAITRENNFRVPDGNYYLCDSGYTNGDGFLAPYRGVRYHIQEWNSHRTPPQNAHELFNKVDARARNVIERIEMSFDPLEAEFPEVDDQISDDHNATFIDQVEPSQQWTNCRERIQWLPHQSEIEARRLTLLPVRLVEDVGLLTKKRFLANALKDLLVRGYKADNGFKSGYQMLLEQAMIQAFSGTNIRAEPHINSRITTDSNARNMRFKMWPLYKDWVEIFGKDRATGEGVESFQDVVQENVNTDQFNQSGKDNEDGGFYVPSFNNPQFDDVQSMSFSNANAGGSSSKSGGKRKRKVVDENDDRFMDLMTSFCDKTDERLNNISRRIGFEHDASLSRKAVFEALRDLGSSLDMERMILVSHLIVNNTKNMNLFFSLPNDGPYDIGGEVS